MSPTTGAASGGICFKWRDTGSCPFGARCKFRHPPQRSTTVGGNQNSQQAIGTSNRRRGICHAWARTGVCRNGNACRFEHVGQGGPSTGNVRRALRSTNADLDRFVKHLAIVKPARIGDELRKSSSMWSRCWRNQSALDESTLGSMLEVLAKMPGSSFVEAPPSNCLETVVDRYLKKAASPHASDEKILTAVKTVANALFRSLDFEWKETREVVEQGLSNSILFAESKLRKQVKDHRPVSNRLMEMLEDVEKSWRIKIADGTENAQGLSDAEATLDISCDYDMWETATVRWLASPDFFAPSRCPVMKSGTNGVYENAEDYMNCVHRLWVAMTFSEGHGALAPHCRSRNTGGFSCGSALWPISDSSYSGARMHCRTKNCRNSVEFCCRIKSHDALCGPCASRSIEDHLGPQGASASTHIYDSEVKSVEVGGIMYLCNFKCRNPPHTAIHWRTTNRLSPPNLVGIVRLRFPGAALEQSDKIVWAEIVYHGRPQDEGRRRQNGELAVNLSSIVEFDPDYFEDGFHVAVVDCKCFVPEWVPVLRAISVQKRSRLPFDNGRHLNICVSQPITSSSSVLDSLSVETVATTSARDLIEALVDDSQLEPIREVRRDRSLKDQLVEKLENLVTATTLDPMQLVSFLDALRNPVHLTQGPPGTGKSYLGVVLVRALIMIRGLWLKKSRSAALSPILVLSYKNHAIDEFLVDLARAEPSLSRAKMIRIGGQCKDTRLAAFSERIAYNQDVDVKMARSTVDKLNNLRESIQVTLDRDVCSFLSHKEQVYGDSDPKIQRKAAYAATDILMSCIARRQLLEFALSQQPDGESQDQIVCTTPAEVGRRYEFLSLNDQRTPDRAIQKIVRSRDGETLVADLVLGRSHYGKEHWGDILLQWLQNKRPRPPCGFEPCNNLALSPDVPYCDSHACSFQFRSGERCYKQCVADDTSFCDRHCCAVEDCKRGCLLDQTLCSYHACQQCVRLGHEARMAAEPPPRNFCEDHPLCMFMSCLDPCLEGALYCAAHRTPKCMALTTKGRPCKGTPKSPMMPFCHDHLHMAKSILTKDTKELNDEVQEAVAKQASRRCESRKVDGTQCKGTALPGSTFCYDHAGGTDGSGAQSSIPNTKTVLESSEVDGENMPKVGSRRDASRLGQGFYDPIKKQPSTEQSEISSDKAVAATSHDQRSPNESNGEESSVDDSSSAPHGEDYDLEELNEGTNLQHLRDVFELVGSDDLDESIESSSTQSDDDVWKEENASDRAFDPKLADPNLWTWEMTLEERWSACEALMDKLACDLVSVSATVKRAVVSARKDFQQTIVRAKARVYEDKSVIGGTMVGCISRLESIRKTKPFAIVCEEASEVLEPLIFSCLSESTIKLEMIGDHRQLSPSVMDRYEFELVNNVNVSLFQRLIESPASHPVPSAVLSIQRRMRRNVCDLTRNFYKDITEIQDHETCGKQVIGHRNAAGNQSMIEASCTSGREIPGIAPHVFLWTHNGKQERSQVGVSRMNVHEAVMACGLAAYLVQCGVPRPSIVILTPYKGQLMQMRHMLLSDARFSALKLISRDPQKQDVCRLSTVDRFQGDEEDVCIVSLVVDQNSKTGFVKLVNRMIVLLSRARLGLYLLGNTAYFESNGLPEHWATTFKRLQEPSSSDSTGTHADLQGHFDSPRCGPAIPLCCPLHRDVVKSVSTPDALKLGFCDRICEKVLNCGHPCSLRCHWKDYKNHNKRCTMKLESPCKRHPKTVECHTAFQRARLAPSGTTHQTIMDYYRCEELVDFVLKCGHSIHLKCFEEKRISAGEVSEPVCNRASPVPFTMPCGHQRDVTCAELARFRDNASLVKCKEKIVYESDCGHSHEMECWRRPSVSETFSCEKKVEVKLPRCGHRHTVKCYVAQTLTCWKGVSCQQIGTLTENVSYGPEDYPCRVMAKIERACGHTMNLPCAEAFARVQHLSACSEQVSTQHPSCGHDCLLSCKLVEDLKAKGHQAPSCVDEFHEGQVLDRSLFKGVPPCKKTVKLVRACGHETSVLCSDVQKPIAACREKTKTQSPLCGHDLKVECNVKAEFETDIWDSSTFTTICKEGRIPKDAKPISGSPSSTITRWMQTCKNHVVLDLPCGHKRKVQCGVLPGIVFAKSMKLPACEMDVAVKLQCGHEAVVKCGVAEKHAQGKHQIVCRAKKRKRCWNFDICHSLLEVDCTFQGTVACTVLTDWRCPNDKHTFKLNQCSEGLPLDCPSCLRDHANSLLSHPPDLSSQGELRRVLADIKPDCVVWINRPSHEYLGLEKQLNERHAHENSQKDLWSSKPIFSPKRIACFRVLAKKHLNADLFDPRKFVNKEKSYYGIMTKRLSAKNLEIMAASAKDEARFTLLVGYVSVVKVKVIPPGTKPPPIKERLAFVVGLTADDYDSLSFEDEQGLDCVVAWDPFPFHAVCRVVLMKEGLEDIAAKIDSDLKLPHLEASFIRFGEKPSSHKVVSSVVAVSADDERLDSDIESENSTTIVSPNPRLSGTDLEGMRLDGNWTGGISSDGDLPESVEKDLYSKMHFSNKKAAPFAGIQLLRELDQQLNVPLLHLFLSAETLEHDPKEARKFFDEYVKSVRASGSRCIHPWSLVVASRLSNSKQTRSSLVALFADMFPMQKRYLDHEEIDLLSGSLNELKQSAKNWQETLWEKWTEIKKDLGSDSKATDDLLQLVGLRKVKNEVISLWKTALQLKRMDPETRKKNQISGNYCFVGNPGTGKTTVCRLFAQILCESGIRSKTVFVETDAQKVKDGGTKEFNGLVKKAMGGVLFIDEAYNLDPMNDSQGRPIVNELLTICENDRDNISCVLAGYEDDFQKKFFAYNVGLRSRFRIVVFEDFDESELKVVWNDMRKGKKWSEETGVASVAAKRLVKAAGRKGFGNARAVRQLLESATKAAMTRLGNEFSMDAMKLTIEDVIGEDPRLGNEKLKRVLDDIYEKVGWDRVKIQIRELIDLCGANYRRELLGKPPLDIFLNRMGLGNPGTGKTTFGKLYGRLLKELGFLSQGDVISKSASDFVGSHVGESQSNTVRILESAKGKVLIIDEAYNLDDNLYGKQVLDTLVEKVQGGASDDLAVLLLGYEGEMKRMITSNNPGLARRFPKDHSFYFDDYNDHELLAILDLNIKKMQVETTMAFRERSLEVLKHQRKQANFGNAGSVEQVLKGAIQIASKRAASGDAIVLKADDVLDPGSTRSSKNEDPMEQLDTLYRMEKVKEKLQKMKISWEVARRDGSEDPELGHFVFTGSPGTGKTTVARAIADILFSLSLKPSNVIVETSALKLTGEFVGQTKKKVHEMMKDAMGGILFIDEAYNLGDGVFGKDACDTLVEALTSDEFKGVTVVIAGYAKEINKMLDSNPGLKSRFTNFFEFPNWEPNDCVSFFKALATKESFLFDDLAVKELHDGCRRLIQLKGWGNGRDVKELWKQAKENRAERVFENKEIEKTIVVNDVAGAIKAMLQARIGKLSEPAGDPLSELDKLFRMEHIKAKIEKMRKTWAVERREGGEVPNIGHFVFTGSPGTGKTTVARAIAGVLFGLELKPSDKIVETTALDMTGDFVGHTVTKVNGLLDDAKGGVLFIDEAYNFDGSFGKEAIDTLVAAMTSDEYRDVQIVIAGYPVEIDEMFRRNGGLKSRFTHFFEFKDWNKSDCAAFFSQCADRENLAQLDGSVLNAVGEGCASLISMEGWANGRDVRRLFDEAKSNRAERCYDSPVVDGPKTLLLEDVLPAVTVLQDARKPKQRKAMTQSRGDLCAPLHATDAPTNVVPPSTDVSSNERNETCEKTQEAERDKEASEQENNSDNESDKDGSSSEDDDEMKESEETERDEGVPDEVWNELRRCKAREQDQHDDLIKLKEEEDRIRREEEDAKRRHKEEIERIQRQLAQEEQERALQELKEREARRRHEELLRLKKIEAERKRKEEELRRRERIKQRLRAIGKCPMGFEWHKLGNGWRCGGGSHFVSNDELHRRFGHDI